MRIRFTVDFHLNRLVALALVLMVVCTTSAGGIVFAARHNPNTYGCLEYDSNALTVGMLLDVASGRSLHDHRTLPALKPQLTLIPSPDGRYVAHREYLGQSALNALFITPPHSANSVKIEAAGVMDNLWSPDSQQIAYFWADQSGYYLVIVRPDGTKKRKTWIGPGLSYFVLKSWSKDSQYLMVDVPFLQGRVINFYSSPDLRLALSVPESVGIDLVWSPQGHQLAQYFTDGSHQNWLRVLSPESGKTIQFAIPKTFNISRISWSPDSRSIMLQYYVLGPHWFFNLYKVDGSAYPKIASALPISTNSLLEFPVWSPDGRVLMAFADQNGGQDLILFHPDTGITETVVSHVEKDIAFSPDNQHVAVTYQLDGHASADVMALDGSQHFTLVSGADDMGNPSWSADSQTVAIVWAVGQRTHRHVYLTWASADGTVQHTLDDHFWDVQAVHWLSDGQSLAYVAWHSDGFSVETADLQTGTSHQVANKLADVAMLGQDADNRLVFWWKGKDGNGGVDAYQPDGKLIQRFPITGPIPTLAYARLFLAPDQQSAAIKLGPFRSESLQIAASDGRSSVVRRGLSGLGDPVWSPDSQQIVFTQSINNLPETLEVVTSGGTNRLHTFLSPPGYYYNVRWTRCN